MPTPSHAILYYFSGTGRTWRVARLYAAELERQSVRCQLSPLELGPIDDPLQEEEAPPALLILGIPLYARTVAREIAAWVDALGQGHGRTIALFFTCRDNQGTAPYRFASRLRSLGYDVRHQALYFSSATTSRDASSDAWLLADVHEAVADILAGRSRAVAPAESLAAPTAIVRAGHWLARRKPTRMLQVEDTCNLCMTCLRLCPVGAISVSRPIDAREGNELGIQVNRACMLCMRCVAACPSQAIALRHTEWLAGVGTRITVEPGFCDAIETAYKT